MSATVLNDLGKRHKRILLLSKLSVYGYNMHFELNAYPRFTLKLVKLGMVCLKWALKNGLNGSWNEEKCLGIVYVITDDKMAQ